MKKHKIFVIALLIITIISSLSAGVFGYLYFTAGFGIDSGDADIINENDDDASKEGENVVNSGGDDSNSNNTNETNQGNSDVKFVINNEDKYISQKNGWQVIAAYTVTEDLTNKRDGLDGIWIVPTKDVWVLQKGDIELIIDIPYITAGTMGFEPVAVEEGFEATDFETGGGRTLMKKKDGEIYKYQYATENDKYGQYTGEDIFYPDIKYFQMGPVVEFRFEGSKNNVTEVEKKILEMYKENNTGWWSE
jgi:hypothetical protein